jgi:hypothetical protein
LQASQSPWPFRSLVPPPPAAELDVIAVADRRVAPGSAADAVAKSQHPGEGRERADQVDALRVVEVSIEIGELVEP